MTTNSNSLLPKKNRLVKLLWGDKDGGPESRVWCWGIESKRFGSVLLLKFAKGSREAFHTHAFNSISWLLRGRLLENFKTPFAGLPFESWALHQPGCHPIRTYRDTYHKVEGMADATWVLTFRGPWVDTWKDLDLKTGHESTLTHGRKEVQ